MHGDRLPAASSVKVAFEQTTYTVSEGDGTTEVCVVVSGVPGGGLECDIVVTLTTINSDKAGRVCRWCTEYTMLYHSSLSSQMTLMWQTHSQRHSVLEQHSLVLLHVQTSPYWMMLLWRVITVSQFYWPVPLPLESRLVLIHLQL